MGMKFCWVCVCNFTNFVSDFFTNKSITKSTFGIAYNFRILTAHQCTAHIPNAVKTQNLIPLELKN